jgi:hypothetical protein
LLRACRRRAVGSYVSCARTGPSLRPSSVPARRSAQVAGLVPGGGPAFRWCSDCRRACGPSMRSGAASSGRQSSSTRCAAPQAHRPSRARGTTDTEAGFYLRIADEGGAGRGGAFAWPSRRRTPSATATRVGARFEHGLPGRVTQVGLGARAADLRQSHRARVSEPQQRRRDRPPISMKGLFRGRKRASLPMRAA